MAISSFTPSSYIYLIYCILYYSPPNTMSTLIVVLCPNIINRYLISSAYDQNDRQLIAQHLMV